MKKAERKQNFAEVISLMLTGKNKEAYIKLVCMCGTDTGLFIMADYDKSMEALKSEKTRSIDIPEETEG